MSRNSGSKDSGERVRNKEFARVTYFFVILFIALMGYLVYFMVVRAKLVVNSPYNQRQDAYADTIIRGSIVDKNGNVLAQTVVGDDGSETREYPYGEVFAHVIRTVIIRIIHMIVMERFHREILQFTALMEMHMAQRI